MVTITMMTDLMLMVTAPTSTHPPTHQLPVGVVGLQHDPVRPPALLLARAVGGLSHVHLHLRDALEGAALVRVQPEVGVEVGHGAGRAGGGRLGLAPGRGRGRGLPALRAVGDLHDEHVLVHCRGGGGGGGEQSCHISPLETREATGVRQPPAN